MSTKTPFAVRWYAFTGGVIGLSISYSLLLPWNHDFQPTRLFDLFLDVLLKPMQSRRRWGPTAFEEFVDLLFQSQVIGFATVWGAVHGYYIGLIERGQDSSKKARLSGLASFLLACSFLMWVFYLHSEYSYWVFGDVPFHVGVLWKYGTDVGSPYWLHVFFPPYFEGLACLFFSALGLALARRRWLQVLFLLPTFTVAYWLSWNPLFPWKVWMAWL